MKQHPIPQNVTQYQFRLVGNMTLKQFLELAGGLILAYLTYASNLLVIFKLPLALTFALAGVGMAFFPLEERPLDQWIINFIKAIYSPTLYYWKKEPHLPDIFQTNPIPQTPPTQTKTKPNQLASITQLTTEPETDKTDPESSLLQKINQLFSQFPQTPPKPIADQTTQSTPNHQFKKPSIRIRKLSSNPTSPPTVQDLKPKTQNPTPTNIFSSSPQTPPPKPKTQDLRPKTQSPTPTTIFQQQPPLTLEKVSKETITQTAPTETIDITPLTPSKPGLIAGLVTDANQKILPNVIVEVVDSQGIPQRAVKTNALGQFSISTPLSPGKYFIKIDDESLHIPSQEITVNDQIIPPIHLHPTPV